MDDAAIWAIAFVILLVVLAGIYSWFSGPSGPMAGSWRDELKELEIRVRMSHGTQLIDDLRQTAQLYLKLGRRYDADKAMVRALTIGKQEFGADSLSMVPLLKEHARVMRSLHRKKEAKSVDEQIKKIEQIAQK